MTIKFSIVQGSLPPGLTLAENGRISGVIPDIEMPEWQTPEGRLPDLVSDEPVNFTFVASAAASRTIVAYQTVGVGQAAYDGLPTGVILDTETGVLSGSARRDPTEGDFASDEAPVWETPAGELPETDEHATYSFTFAASAVRGTSIRYIVLPGRGSIPFGLVLDSATGVLSGVCGEEFGPPDPRPGAVTWTTLPGVLGTVNEFATFTATVAATSEHPIRYVLLPEYGGLPFGLTLDSVTGTISGTLAELTDHTEPYVRPASPPVWVTASALGAVNSGAGVNIFLSATAIEGRTMRRYYLADGSHLPHGLILNSDTGIIAGTAQTVSEDTNFAFSVYAEDSAGARARRDFTLTIKI